MYPVTQEPLVIPLVDILDKSSRPTTQTMIYMRDHAVEITGERGGIVTVILRI